MEKLKTQFQTDNEKEQRKIAAEFLAMVAEGSSKTAVTAFLRKKYGIHSNNTIHLIRIKYAGHVVKHRVEKVSVTDKADIGDELCKYCTLEKKGNYGVDGGYMAGCEGSRCNDAYENYLESVR